MLLPHALAVALDVPEAEHAVRPRAAERLGAPVEEDEVRVRVRVRVRVKVSVRV